MLHQFATLEEAQLAVSFLENEGVKAHVWDEQIAALYPMFNPAIGMVRVAVHEDDWDQANTILGDYLTLMRDGSDASWTWEDEA